MASDDSSKLFSAMSVVAALGAATLAKKGLGAGWQAATGRKPPENPADPDVAIWEAVAWATVSGVFVGLARMLAQRRAADYYVRSAGKLPGQLKHDGQ
jgi:hypothetical protein